MFTLEARWDPMKEEILWARATLDLPLPATELAEEEEYVKVDAGRFTSYFDLCENKIGWSSKYQNQQKYILNCN